MRTIFQIKSAAKVQKKNDICKRARVFLFFLSRALTFSPAFLSLLK